MQYDKLCSDFECITHNLAIEFLKKMHDGEIITDFYWIDNDPTGTLAYGDERWSLSTIYNTLLTDKK